MLFAMKVVVARNVHYFCQKEFIAFDVVEAVTRNSVVQFKLLKLG